MSASSFHRIVVEDVIKNMRAEFASEGLDEQVVEDLKQLWEAKLIQGGVYEYPVPAQPAYATQYDYNNYMDSAHTQQTLLPMTQTNMYNMPYVQAPARPPTNNAAHMVAMNALRSLNNTAPGTPQQTALSNSALAPSTLAPNTYGYDATGKPQQYMAPPGSISGWSSQSNSNTQYMTNIRQHDGANDEVDVEKQEQKKIDKILLKKYKKVQRQKALLAKQNAEPQPTTETTIPQFDGLGDRKTEPDELDDDDDDDGSVKGEGDEELGSDLDSDEEEPDTEHIILCQYEKVSRVKNKRKANLKDGIMHINGRDFVFSKATGEFDW